MPKMLIENQTLENIAAAIREKTGNLVLYTPSEMAEAIRNIQNTSEVILISKTISENGTYRIENESPAVTGYSRVIVDVPNTYTANDNGKVVVNQALTAQTELLITENGNYNTTSNNSVVVNIPVPVVNLGGKTIVVNGTYYPSVDDLDGYNSIVVNVPNTYIAGDEGKVVDNGALVSQTEKNISANGVYDTTKNNSVVVNIPSSSATLGTKRLTQNGTFNASADNVDGYSTVIANIYPGRILPIHKNVTSGFVHSSGQWQNTGVGVESDIYQISTGVYLLMLDDYVGTRFRAAFYLNDPYYFTEYVNSDDSGAIVAQNNPTAYAFKTYNASSAGYIAITKDDQGRSDIETYLFKLSDLADGNSSIEQSFTPILQSLTITHNGIYTPDTGYDGFSEVIANFPNQPVIAPKTITSNGTFLPASDNLDAYSAVTVNVYPGRLPTVAYDIDSGYVLNGSWILQDNPNNRADVYQLTANKIYFISLGATVGTRWRLLYTDSNPANANADISGIKILELSGVPSSYQNYFYTPSTTGYLTIQKDNAGTTDLKTYVYDLYELFEGVVVTPVANGVSF